MEASPLVRRNWSMQDIEAAALTKSAAQGGGNKKNNFRPYHAIRVPKSTSLANVFHKDSVDDPSTSVTTLMLRHIPNKYTQANLLDEVNQMGFSGLYDFFYLPMDVQNRTNVGYAFINFMTPQDAEVFRCAMTDYKFKKYSSQKIAKVAPAHIQGLIRNLYHFSTRAVAQSQDITYRPIIMCNGLPRDCLEVLEELRRGKHGKLRPKVPQSAHHGLVQDALMQITEPAVGSQLGRHQSVGPPQSEEVPQTFLGTLNGKLLQECEDPQACNEEDFVSAIFHLKEASAALVNVKLRGSLDQANLEVVQDLSRALNEIAARVNGIGGVSVTDFHFQDNRDFLCDMKHGDCPLSGTTIPPPSCYPAPGAAHYAFAGAHAGATHYQHFPEHECSRKPPLLAAQSVPVIRQHDARALPPSSQVLLGSTARTGTNLWNASAHGNPRNY